MSFDHLTRSRPILRRLLEQDALPGLSEEERRTLEQLAGIAREHEAGEARPLWHWIREGFWRAPRCLQHDFFDNVDEVMDSVLGACGASTPPPTRVGRLLAPVTREGLTSGIADIIRHAADKEAAGWLAMAVAAFAGLAHLVPDIERALRNADEVDRFYFGLAGEAALAVLGCERFLDLESEHMHTTELRLRHVEGLGDSASLETIERALGEDGWSLERIRAHPGVFERFARLGGDVVAVVEGLDTQQSLFASDDAKGFFTAEALARAMLVGGDGVAARGLRALHAHDWSSGLLLSGLYLELAAAGAQAILPVLEERLNALLREERHSSDDETLILLWAIGVLRSDGTSWLEALARAHGQTPEFRMAGILLAVSREDASRLVPETFDHDVEEHFARMAKLARQGRAEECAHAILRKADDTTGAGFGLHLFYRAWGCGGRDTAPFAAALDVLRERPAQANADPTSPPDPAALLPWLGMKCQRATRAVLRRVHLMAPETAAPLLAGILARQKLFAAETNGEDATLLDLALAELGCVPDAADRVGEGIAALLRLSAHSYPTGDPLPEPDRSVALALLAAGPEKQAPRLGAILAGDPAFDVLGSLRLYGGGVEDKDYRFRSIMGDPVGDFIGLLSPTERLSHVLTRPQSVEPEGRLQAALTLMASPVETLRALATTILFDGGPPAPELLSVRRLQLRDPALAVRATILKQLPKATLASDELRCAIAVLSESDDDNERKKLAAFLGEFGSAEHLDVLFSLMFDEEGDVVQEAQKSLWTLLVRDGGQAMVCLSIADPWAVYRLYDLPDSPDLTGLLSDRRAEAMRLMLQAMEKKAKADAARASAGRRMVLMPIRSWPPPPPSGTPLGQEEFEALALHLHVLFVDAATGSIVAEVGTEPTGEVLHAIFETGDTAVMRVVWG